MSTLAHDVRDLIVNRLSALPIADLLDFAKSGFLTLGAAPPVKLNGFVKIGANGESLRDDATDWVAVRDCATGLVWSRDTIGDRRHEWVAAQKAAASVNLCGWHDWRLPTRAELLTLVDDTRHDPAINTDFFQCRSDWYWTSTPAASSPGGYAWGVNFNGGGAGWNGQVNTGLVRAVRASQ